MKRHLDPIHNDVEKKLRLTTLLKRGRDCDETYDIDSKKARIDRKRSRCDDIEDDHDEKRRCIRTDQITVNDVCSILHNVTNKMMFTLMTSMLMASYTVKSFACPVYSNLHLYIK